MPEIITLLERFGIGIAILVGGGFFFWKKFWPWFVERDKARDEILQKRTDQFLEALDRRDREFDRIITSLDRLSEQVRRKK